MWAQNYREIRTLYSRDIALPPPLPAGKGSKTIKVFVLVKQQLTCINNNMSLSLAKLYLQISTIINKLQQIHFINYTLSRQKHNENKLD